MMVPHLYRLATRAASPVAHVVLARRAAQGKEDKARLHERWGRPTAPRPPGRLVWLHAASIGESVSLLPLIDRLRTALPQVEVLVTTGTVTSARLMADRLPASRARHQFLPLDHPRAVARFLGHWRPDLAIWVESELWPNLILETHRRKIPMALVNARMSETSFRGWRRWRGMIEPLLKSFAVVLAQDPKQAERLRALGAANADTVGDLKAAGVLQACDPAALEILRQAVGNRPVWLAASTHAGEEEVVAQAHLALSATQPRLLTLLAPRHPVRADEVARMLAQQGVAFARRSAGDLPDAGTGIYLIDTLGELGLFYRLAPIVLVAGSLGTPGSIGGHNPLEAAQLGCAVLHGPDMVNCAATTAQLDAEGGAVAVTTAELPALLGRLLADPASCTAMGNAARRVAEGNRGVVDAVFAHLLPLIEHLDARA